MSAHDIHRLIAGREAVALQALGIYPQGRGHMRCPFPDHEDRRPSWRWNAGKARWFCTCGSGSVVDAVMRMEGLQAGEAIGWIRELLDGQGPSRRCPPPAAANTNTQDRKLRTRERKAAEAVSLWRLARPAAANHPYLASKAVAPHELREQNGVLYVPLYDIHGRLWNVQTIFPKPDGSFKKRFPKDSRVEGLFSPVGLASAPERLIICEGWATGATLHGETGIPALAAMNAGNLMAVAMAARQAWPEADIILAADNDRHTKGNPGLTKATLAALSVGGRLAVPNFPEGAGRKDTDFNDLKRFKPGAVKAAIEAAVRLTGTEGRAQADDASAKQAAELSRQAVARFMERALTWQPEPAGEGLDFNPESLPPVMAIRGSVGLGKTRHVIERLVDPVLAEKHVAVFAPDHRLNDEWLQRYNALAGPGSARAMVMYGREQVRPDGLPMCAKADLAAALGRLRLPVQTTLCEKKRPDALPERCPHYETCPYQKQKADKEPALRIHPHTDLFIDKKVTRADIIVIDERFYPAALNGTEGRGYSIVLNDLRLPRRGLGDDKNADLVDLGERCVRALRAGGRLADFQAEGITADEAKEARRIEYSRVEVLPVTPGMARRRQEAAIESYRQQTALKLARFFGLLATALDAGIDPHSFRIEEDVPNSDGRPEDLLFMTWSDNVRVPAAPTLLLDADLDPEIAKRFFPQLEEPTIADARPTSYVGTQIVDQRVSMQMTCVSRETRQAIRETRAIPAELSEKDRTCIRNVKRLRQLAEVKAAGGRRGLVVSYLAVEEVMRALPPIPGVEYAHFGNLRGIDRWKDCDFIIVAGSPLVNVDDLERMANALWHLSPEPLTTIPADSAGRRRYSEAGAAIALAGGPAVPVRVPAHPDARCRAIMRQLQREVDQAIGRLRLVHRPADRPAEVLIITNVPTSLPVHQLSTWREILPGPVAVMMARGVVPQRLRDIAKVLPELVKSGQADPRSAVSKALAAAGVDPNKLFTFPYRESFIAESEQFALARYRLAGERKSAAAWVDLHRHPDARAAIEAVLGPLDRFELVEEPSSAGEKEPAVTPKPEPQPPPPPEPDSEPDPWHGWPGPDPDEMRRQPHLVVNNPPELSDEELIHLLPAKRMSDTAVGWEIRAHDVLRARRVEWFRAQRLVREQLAAHDWRPHMRACHIRRPAWASG